MNIEIDKTEPLRLGNLEFTSRLLLGTGKFSNIETMINAIKASETQIVTIALRRFNSEESQDDRS